MNTGFMTSCDQRFENLLRREANRLGGMKTGKIPFIIFVKAFPAGNLRLLHKPYSIGFCCHKITVIYYTIVCQGLQVGIEWP